MDAAISLRIHKLFGEHAFPTENSASHLQPDQQQNLGEMEKQGLFNKLISRRLIKGMQGITR